MPARAAFQVLAVPTIQLQQLSLQSLMANHTNCPIILNHGIDEFITSRCKLLFNLLFAQLAQTGFAHAQLAAELQGQAAGAWQLLQAGQHSLPKESSLRPAQVNPRPQAQQ